MEPVSSKAKVALSEADSWGGLPQKTASSMTPMKLDQTEPTLDGAVMEAMVLVLLEFVFGGHSPAVVAMWRELCGQSRCSCCTVGCCYRGAAEAEKSDPEEARYTCPPNAAFPPSD